MVVVGACCHLLVVMVHAHGVMFVGVCGGSLRAVVDHSWVGAWVLPVACDRSGAGVLVAHYLCVKCGELSMKVVWRAGMAMV